MFANCQAGGMDISAADVCKTPPLAIPVTYSNMANGAEAIPNVPNIIYIGGPVHNLGTIIPVTHNDEGGSMGGVASGTVAGMSRHVNGANTIITGGAPITRMTSMNCTNSQNAVGCRSVPSQTKILILAA
ncbi:DUF4150 domain-containing protein [Collimonas humicola]|uniref:DUF4150 domain-containing protein n=1 Tax=Collimonas humicola TaxID=2825886 RepID=UPI001B8BB256|nr:DUF4150 domain-containing protein [Collimonas humicola]